MSADLFQVVILAGGLATRLQPLTSKIPKSLIEVNGEPFIVHQLRLLQRKGVLNIVLCVGHLAEQIIKKIGDGNEYGVNVVYSYDGPQLLGTAGAIKQAIPLLKDRFFVLYGDAYLPCDYKSAQAIFTNSRKHALMTVFCNRGQWDTSNVEYANGSILSYDKKNITERMHYIDYGLGIFSKEAFDQVPSDAPFDLALLYQNLLAQHQLSAFEVCERFYEVGSFAGLRELEYYLRKM